MEYLHFFKDFVLHLDKTLGQIISTYGTWTYLILFGIIFCETGLVVTPFLPGDSLLFAAGYFAARNDLNFLILFVSLSVAAIVGDAVNYSIGHIFGEKLLKSQNPRIRKIFKPEYIDRTHKFYEKYGKKAIILARFVPIVRTFIPFFAGLGSMRYVEFAVYNVAGGILWVFLMLFAGWWLGGFPIVKDHFELFVIAIVIISILPMVYEYWMHRREQNGLKREAEKEQEKEKDKAGKK